MTDFRRVSALLHAQCEQSESVRLQDLIAFGDVYCAPARAQPWLSTTRAALLCLEGLPAITAESGCGRCCYVVIQRKHLMACLALNESFRLQFSLKTSHQVEHICSFFNISVDF